MTFEGQVWVFSSCPNDTNVTLISKSFQKMIFFPYDINKQN